jgi:hypothetical protein
MARGTFSTLQHLLKQAYSTDVQEQQQAAIELANLIEQAGTARRNTVQLFSPT